MIEYKNQFCIDQSGHAELVPTYMDKPQSSWSEEESQHCAERQREQIMRTHQFVDFNGHIYPCQKCGMDLKYGVQVGCPGHRDWVLNDNGVPAFTDQ